MKLLDNWSPPDGAGAPVACLATSFTLEADFFTQDCLSRFLSLSTASGEGDTISSIVAMLEEEDRLGDAQVSVLVDRSSPAEKRNLRWDVVPVGIRGGLLHAKVAVLLWERSTRIILGSANLTSAGYRRQVELAFAIDVGEGCPVPRQVLEDLVAEVRHLVDMAPGPVAGPKGRAMTTVDLLAARIQALHLPKRAGDDLRLAVAPARPGVSPLDRLSDVWRGGQPLAATMLSPFWDDHMPAPAIDAVRRRLTGRPAGRRSLTLVAAVDPFTGTVQAPPSLASQPGTEVVAFEPPDAELRSLHAKVLLIESDDWLAALIGSSNATEAGFGLNVTRGHHELNLWLGCPATSPTATHLRGLARAGEAIDLDDERWAPMPDEDEVTSPQLPVGFVTCIIDSVKPGRALLELDSASLPAFWEVRSPTGRVLLTADQWHDAGAPTCPAVHLLDEALPAFLFVHWHEDGASLQATWTANVQDRSALPAPAQLAELSVEVLLAVLASHRPLPAALDHELRRRARPGDDSFDLDPLRRFDDTGLLLQRARHVSLALWRLQTRLGRPVSSLDSLNWRMHGAFGPLAIAEGLVRAAAHARALPGETHFLLAELALTVSAVDWRRVAAGVDVKEVQAVVAEVLAAIGAHLEELPPAPDAAIDDYVCDALKEAQR